MAGSGRVRLVTCPKCKNVLPEQGGFSVYQCGGCGAVLRGKFVYCFRFSLLLDPTILTL